MIVDELPRLLVVDITGVDIHKLDAKTILRLYAEGITVITDNFKGILGHIELELFEFQKYSYLSMYKSWMDKRVDMLRTGFIEKTYAKLIRAKLTEYAQDSNRTLSLEHKRVHAM